MKTGIIFSITFHLVLLSLIYLIARVNNMPLKITTPFSYTVKLVETNKPKSKSEIAKHAVIEKESKKIEPKREITSKFKEKKNKVIDNKNKKEQQKEKPIVSQSIVTPVQTVSTTKPEISASTTFIATEGVEFPYAYYLAIIQSKISENWTPPEGIIAHASKLKTVVFFTINKKGEIIYIELEESSGSPVLDQSAVRAVKLAHPLPPLPKGFPHDLLRVHFTFWYNIFEK